MFDSHCHLNSLYSLSKQQHSLLLNADDYYLAVSTHASEWLDTLSFCDLYSNIFPALGIHPWFVKSSHTTDLSMLDKLLAANPITAVGEIGLDFKPQYQITKPQQLEVFSAQLTFATDYNRPVSMHIIKAHNEACSILKTKAVRGVVHGLGSSIEVVKNYLDLGLKIGVNGVSCRDNARRYHDLIRYCGLENIVLETDYPNIILPAAKTAALGDIYQVAEFVAELINQDIDTVISTTELNAKQIFCRNVKYQTS